MTEARDAGFHDAQAAHFASADGAHFAWQTSGAGFGAVCRGGPHVRIYAVRSGEDAGR